MTEEQKEWINFVGEYAGKTSRKINTKKGEMIKFTLLFNISGSQYQKKVHVFEETLKSICEKNKVDFKELGYYNVSAVKNEYVAEGENRFIWSLGKLSPATKEEFESNSPLKSPQTGAPTSNVPPVAEAQDWVKFVNEYNENMKEGGNAMHLLGAYVANKHGEQFKNIIELCKKNFEK